MKDVTPRHGYKLSADSLMKHLVGLEEDFKNLEQKNIIAAIVLGHSCANLDMTIEETIEYACNQLDIFRKVKK